MQDQQAREIAGFTLIELVIVIVLLTILSSVALPRFMNITDNAHDTSLQGTVGALGAAVKRSHTKWLASGQPIASQSSIQGLSFREFGKIDIGFSLKGWPNAANNGTNHLSKEDILSQQNQNNDNICRHIASNLLSASRISFGVGKNCQKDYCASYQAPHCIFHYQKKQSIDRVIFYNTQDGRVFEASL